MVLVLSALPNENGQSYILILITSANIHPMQYMAVLPELCFAIHDALKAKEYAPFEISQCPEI